MIPIISNPPVIIKVVKAVSVIKVVKNNSIIKVQGVGLTGPPCPPGSSGSIIVKKNLTSQIDGSNINFAINQSFLPGSTQIYLNGLLLDEEDYIEAVSSIILGEAPFLGDRLTILYTPE